MKIGEIMAADREITLNEGKKTVTVTVANKGDRPVQVGSHFHFFEVNKCLSFDREKAYGYHLDIPSGYKSNIHGNCEIKRISVRRDNNEYKNFRKQICGNVWPDYRR